MLQEWWKKNSEYGKKAIISMYLVLLTFVLMMQSPVSIWKINGTPNTDASVFKTVAMYMQKGKMPYRDIFDHKGPLLYIYNWLGNMIAPWKGIWVIEFISLCLCVFTLYKVARLICGRGYACIAMLVVFAPLYEFTDGGNMSEEFALPFIAIALYIFMD